MAARVDLGEDQDSGVARSLRAGTNRSVKARPTMRPRPGLIGEAQWQISAPCWQDLAPEANWSNTANRRKMRPAARSTASAQVCRLPLNH